MPDPDDVLRIGTPNIVTGDHPRTLWTVANGENLSCGTEEIEPSSEIPWHAHPDAEEVLVCIKGSGTILTGSDASFDFSPGVPFHVKRTVQHRIVNRSDTDKLWLTWTLSPPQSVNQFQARSHNQTVSADGQQQDVSLGSAFSKLQRPPLTEEEIVQFKRDGGWCFSS